MSLFERQKAKYCRRYDRAHQELDDFVESVETQVGKDVGVVFRAYVDDVPWGARLNGERLPEIPVEGLPLLDDFLRLNRQEAVVMWKLRHSAFGYHEPPTPPYVFWCYGLSWDEISVLEEDRKLPVGRVAELLEMLVDGEPVVSGSDWEKTFRRKRRHLTWLFRTAVRLGEDLECWL
jgi:hypothetical protein